VSEIEFLRRLAARVKQGEGVVRGIGDDCAILRLRRGEELLVHTDLVVEGVHFKKQSLPAEAAGYKTLARGLSDVAAMGGDPRWALVSVALPSWARGEYIDEFFRGFLKLARRHGVTLVGGDISRSRTFTADIVILGSAPRGRALRRDTVRPGDHVYVSGALGKAAASNYLAPPQPRLAVGRALRGRATACMDLSDGLSIDLHRMCLASQAAAEIDRIPVARGATEHQALHGGEDYELLFTSRTLIPARVASVRITRIGRIVEGPAGSITYKGRPLAIRGWDHLGRRLGRGLRG
jgi:thiamine-monophosphate kinase